MGEELSRMDDLLLSQEQLFEEQLEQLTGKDSSGEMAMGKVQEMLGRKAN